MEHDGRCKNCGMPLFTADENAVPVNPAKLYNVCEKISPGCAHCYACDIGGRWGGPDYTAKALKCFTPVLDEKGLAKLLRFKPKGRPGMKPMVFAHDMTDAFLGFWPDEFLDRFFAVVALRPDVIWQLLSKRPERMLAYFSTPRRWNAVAINAEDLAMKEITPVWPLPNLHLGVSVEDQRHADERIPLLLQTPAAVRFVSYEPALGAAYFRPAWIRPQRGCEGLHHHHDEFCGPRIDWLILGGESGPGARPCDVAWIRSAVEQCKAAGVAVFVKQLGSKITYDREFPGWQGVAGRLRDRKGGDPAEWPEDLSVREFPMQERAVPRG